MEFREPFLVVGSKGMLGTDLLARLCDCGKKAIGVDIDEIDIRRRESVADAAARYAAGTIINVAAMTDVDGCESRREEAFEVNAQGPANLAELVSEGGGGLIHLSTDYVFNGRARSPYGETDRMDPVGIYGKSKARGEMRVREILPDRHCIVRTQWLFGRHGKNFVEAILEAAKTRDVLRVVDDQRGSPTYAADLAGALVELCDKGVTGTVHVTNSGNATWHEFAAAIIEQAGAGNVRVEPITTEELGRPAPRPAYSVLDTAKFVRLVGKPLRHWRAALVHYLNERTRNTGFFAKTDTGSSKGRP
ncbi:MAG: dTDP-4-dehydrorhamnose reductase [Desulfomonilaceae bacterium]|nr:dTDP-4-dehydrorhamnose reductase [Desulfomonilaceae bacterium]